MKENDNYGSFLLRFFAYLFDILLLWFVPLVLLLVIVVSSDNTASFWLGLLWLFWEIIFLQWIISWVYRVITFLYLKASLGKILAGLEIEKEDKSKPTFSDALIRFPVGYTVSNLFWLGFLCIIKDEKKKGFHDHFAGTVVVRKHSSIPLFFALPLLIITYLIIFFLIIQIGINKDLWFNLYKDLSLFWQSIIDSLKGNIESNLTI